MHLCHCHVMLGGDRLQVVQKQGIDAVTWPEVQVLKFIHGEESVTEVEVVGTVDRSNKDEIARLSTIYGDRLVKGLFPMPKMLETEAPGFENAEVEHRESEDEGLAAAVEQPHKRSHHKHP